MHQRADARRARAFILSTRRPTNAQTGFLPCCHIGEGRRGLPSTRWPERGVTGDDEAGASRLPLIRPTKSRAGRKEAHGGCHGCALNHGDAPFPVIWKQKGEISNLNPTAERA